MNEQTTQAAPQAYQPVRISVYLQINNKPLDTPVGWMNLLHPETAERDIATGLRELADAVERDSEFWRLAIAANDPLQ